jgi:hypothetical protein
MKSKQSNSPLVTPNNKNSDAKNTNASFDGSQVEKKIKHNESNSVSPIRESQLRVEPSLLKF